VLRYVHGKTSSDQREGGSQESAVNALALGPGIVASPNVHIHVVVRID
jgi:hypothetical protein